MSNILQYSNVKLQPIFAQPRTESGQYLYDLDSISNNLKEGNISIPLNIDTEFKTFISSWITGNIVGRLGITTQVRGIAVNSGVIFSHPEVAKDLPEYDVASSGFHPVDYLNSLGYAASIRKDPQIDPYRPVCEFVLYGHFLLAELMMIARGDFQQDICDLMRVNSPSKPRFEMQRRIRAVTPSPAKYGRSQEYDYVAPKWVLDVQGIEYNVRIVLVDTVALHGMASYKDLADAVGFLLTDKDNFTSKEKSEMLKMVKERPEDFQGYALGDLYCYDILQKNADQWKKVYEQLELSQYYKVPKLTIGSTVKDLFIAALRKKFVIDTDEKLKELIKLLEPASAGKIKEYSKDTKALLAKVVGGRCRNNRPTWVNVETPLVDLDISGCYGEGQRNQDYYIGLPEVLDYPVGSSNNGYMSLGTWLDGGRLADGSKYPGMRSELVPGGWHGIVSTLDNILEYPQDFLASWFVDGKDGEEILAKYVEKAKADSEKADTDFDVEDGTQKILNYQILNGTITSDFIDWLDNIPSAKQRKELMDKLFVKAAMYYPKSMRCETFKEFMEALKNHKSKNLVKRKGRGKSAQNVKEDGECHAWLSVNLGELLINDLLANRKMYPKKTPLNTLFKLCVNTLYGDMTSKFFTSANVVVGNNITARARALAWYMEKGLWGFQTITDGCAFELNRVVQALNGRRVTSAELTNLYQKLRNSNLRTSPVGSHVKLGAIGELERIELNWLELTYFDSDKGELVTAKYPEVVLVGTDSIDKMTPSVQSKDGKEFVDVPGMTWINQICMEHLQNLFPNVAVLHAESSSLKVTKDAEGKPIKTFKPRKGQFEFEAKDFYDSGVFHGTANYCLKNPNGQNVKMRSYETKKTHESIEFIEGIPAITGRYGETNNPASDFLGQLTHPESVQRQPSFVKEAIVKLGDFKNRQKSYDVLGLVPGDGYPKSGLLREFSLSQFTFKTLEQYQGWSKAIGTRKEKLGQSLEQFFINPDGTLNYLEMVKTVDSLIQQDVINPFKVLDASRNVAQPHPEFETLLNVRKFIQVPETRLEFDN